MEKDKNLRREKNNQALRFVQILIGGGIFSVVIYALTPLWWTSGRFAGVISFFSLGTLISGSTLTGGCLIGFIFAIPKTISDLNPNLIKVGKNYVGNDNLVQVSDWLTKIIVGVGLTKLTKIPGYIQSIGRYVGGSIGGSTIGEIAAESMVIYFSICGFLLAYLWTRLYFARMLEDSEIIESLSP